MSHPEKQRVKLRRRKVDNVKIENYINKPKEELEKMTTPQLLMLRKQIYRAFLNCGSACHCEPTDKKGREFNAQLSVLQAHVLAILPTREHVPNKIEAKAARQAAAKKGR
jgi:hypothetical protein